MSQNEGKHNVLADAFSHLPTLDRPSISEGKSAVVDETSLFTDCNMMECFANFPGNENSNSPLDLEWIQRVQFEDVRLQQRRQECPQLFPIKCIDDIPIMCCRNDPHLPWNEWRICIPAAVLTESIQWFHLILGHRGKTQVCDAMRRMCHHLNLKAATLQFECDVCQKSKLQGAQCGELPP